MNKLDQHLQRVQEFDPIITSAAVGTAWILSSLITLLYMSFSLKRSVKIDPKLSSRINKILGTSNKWTVHVYKTKEPNAFSLGFGTHIFITTKLIEMLTPKQIDSVLLHEVWHSKAKHIPKQLAFMYPLYYLIAGAAIGTATATGGNFLLAYVVLMILDSSSKGLWNILFSQRHEIHADEYATKLGYGKELVESLKVIENFAKKHTDSSSCGKICQLIEKINGVFAEHPAIRKRIELILRKSTELNKALKSGSFGKIKNFVVKAWGK